MAAQGSLYTSHYCIRQVISVEKGLVIISEACGVLIVQRANIRNSWELSVKKYVQWTVLKGRY